MAQIIERDSYLIGFGEATLHEAHLPPQTLWLKQVHGNRVIPANHQTEEADGHFSSQSGICLGIRTADCMPVLFAAEGAVYGLHIGWRGLRAKIMTEALKTLHSQETIEIFVGPHIQQSSFELDLRSSESLLKPHGLSIRSGLRSGLLLKSVRQSHHFHVNLSGLLKEEVQRRRQAKWWVSPVDTFRSAFHCSYRRRSLVTGRNLSFIYKK